MYSSETEKFDANWNDFITKVKAQIYKRSQGKLPSFPVLQTILDDCKMDWIAEDTKYGRWLLDYSREHPEKGNLIKQILAEDMQFAKRSEKQGVSNTVMIAAPLVGAVAGFSISHMFHAPFLAQAVFTVVPAALAPQVVKSVDAKIGRTNVASETDAYMEQLQKYYLSVKSVLETL